MINAGTNPSRAFTSGIDYTSAPIITAQAFKKFRTFLYDSSGISLGTGRESMVQSRLTKRLRHYGMTCFDEYFELVESGNHPDEYQIVLNLLSTNETYFFREQEHFNFLEKHLRKPTAATPFRVWSAASSSGEEAYSIAMLLADKLGVKASWEVFGSDINTEVIETARQGHYRMERIDGIPKKYLQQFCLKGTGEYANTLLINPNIRQKVNFQQMNLMHPIPNIGNFDVIFLRNVLIYFDKETKALLAKKLNALLKPGGYFIIGHSESIKGMCTDLKPIGNTIYQKEA